MIHISISTVGTFYSLFTVAVCVHHAHMGVMTTAICYGSWLLLTSMTVMATGPHMVVFLVLYSSSSRLAHASLVGSLLSLRTESMSADRVDRWYMLLCITTD